MAAKRDKNAAAAKCWGNALSAVAVKRQKFATDDKDFGNAQGLLNAKNTQRLGKCAVGAYLDKNATEAKC